MPRTGSPAPPSASSSANLRVVDASAPARDGYQGAGGVDELRAREYPRLAALNQVYLDHAGGGLYADSQLRRHTQLLERTLLGNPRGHGTCARTAAELCRKTRQAVLSFFNASPDEYLVIFTSNASAAVKLVGEAYPFRRGSTLLLSADNHNSVNGLREFARSRGARHHYLPIDDGELRLRPAPLREALRQFGPPRRRWPSPWSFTGARGGAAGHLFAYPAQSNFSGVQHALDWIPEAQRWGWDVLLDAAAFVPTNRLDLGRHQPDFVTLSFYKMMGYPTGLGCLLARRRALAKLRRPWFAGGSAMAATVLGDRHQVADDEAAFEDGTVDYLSIPAVLFGLEHLAEVGIDVIHQRTQHLTGWLLERLGALHHGNGQPLVRLYGPRHTEGRGAIVAFNLLDPDGRVVDERLVERAALERHISLRTGCFCNPGAGEAAFGLEADTLAWAYRDGGRLTYDRLLRTLGLPSAGAIRLSLGLTSSFEDLHHFLELAHTFLDRGQDTSGLGPRQHC
jgi:molybdenum cofactor sulfurtransferase